MAEVVPIIIAGGSGTRLWPWSREHYPKQFLALSGGQSFLQQTLQRVPGDFPPHAMMPGLTVTNEAHRFLVQDQAREAGLPGGRIVLEPEGRNTAPALTAAAALLADADPVMLVMPADHGITDVAAFHAALHAAIGHAERGGVVTLGIVPVRAETGYGYIECDMATVRPDAVRPVLRFVEKPDLATAESYVRAGNFLWNSGVFVLRRSVWMEAMERFRPDILGCCRAAVRDAVVDGDFLRLGQETFLSCPAQSIDYAVMEPASRDGSFALAVVPLDAGWSDVGSWSAVRELAATDDSGNLLMGDVAARATRNCVIAAQDRFVAVLGCSDIVVAETADAVLVAGLDAAQQLSAFVRDLKSAGRPEAEFHQRVFRPWGSFESVLNGNHYQVKRLTITAGKKLSLQLHHHRAEHWVVVRGTATVVRDAEVVVLRENESIYIPRETRHRLANETDTVLEVIEVQTGDYLGEDDIVRFEDDFGRVEAGSG